MKTATFAEMTMMTMASNAHRWRKTGSSVPEVIYDGFVLIMATTDIVHRIMSLLLVAHRVSTMTAIGTVVRAVKPILACNVVNMRCCPTSFGTLITRLRLLKLRSTLHRPIHLLDLTGRRSLIFTGSRSGSVTRENELSTEINSSLETKITAGYSYPSFGGRSLSAEVVNENSITLTRSSRTFQQVVESYGDSTSTMRTIDIQAPENFEDRIRVVSYRLTRTTTVHGTAFLGIAGGTVTESVSMDLTTDQEGFLILRIGNFPGLETMTNEEVVLAYVRGELLGPGSDGQPLYREETEAPTTPPPTTSPTTSPTLEPTLDQNSTNPTSGPTQAPMPETTPLPTDDAASVDQNSTGTPSWPFPSPTEDEPSNPPTDLSSSAAFRDKSTIIGAMFFFSLIIVVVLVSL